MNISGEIRWSRRSQAKLFCNLARAKRFAMYDCDEYDPGLKAPDATDILAVAVSGQKNKRSRQ